MDEVHFFSCHIISIKKKRKEGNYLYKGSRAPPNSFPLFIGYIVVREMTVSTPAVFPASSATSSINPE